MNKIILPVLGGIGNQLFQLSALADLSANADLIVDHKLFFTSSDHSAPNLETFELCKKMKFCEFKRWTWISRRMVGVSLRTAKWKKSGGARGLSFSIIKIVTELCLTMRYQSTVSIFVSSEIGYEEISTLEKCDSLVLIGYFQSHKYHKSQDQLKRSLELEFMNPITSDYFSNELTSISNPLIVHVRRGDYLHDPELGVLSTDYYLKNIPKVLELSGANSIWLFTNDIEYASACIPRQFKTITQLMEIADLTDLDTLEIMKLGHAYLTANSTFSWWAAYLSNAEPRNIYIPNPWYLKKANPNELSPKEWNRLDAIFS